MSYHVNNDGEVKICNAKSPATCKFASEHFYSEAEAQEYADKVNEWETDLEKAYEKTGDESIKEYRDLEIFKYIASIKNKELYRLSEEEFDEVKREFDNVQNKLREIRDTFNEKKDKDPTYEKVYDMAMNDMPALFKVKNIIEDEESFRMVKKNLDDDGFTMIEQDEEEFLEMESYKLFENLNDEEKKHVEGYSDMAYSDINAYLRGNTDDSTLSEEDIKKHIDTLDKINIKMPKDTKLFRGTGFKFFKGMKEGDVFESNSYFSTSASYSESLNFIEEDDSDDEPCLIEINAPKGSKGFYMPLVSSFSHEKEMLLPRENKYKVVSMKKDKGLNRIKIEIV